MSATTTTRTRGTSPGARRTSRTESHRRRRITGRALALLVVVGALLFAGMYPLRAYLQERAKITTLQEQVDGLQRQNNDLDRRIAELKDPAFLEQLARNCLGMVKPGEIPFIVVPKHGKAGSVPC